MTDQNSEIEHLRAEVKRMRNRIETLRGALKSASGWLLDASDRETDSKYFLSCSKLCLDFAGDMEQEI